MESRDHEYAEAGILGTFWAGKERLGNKNLRVNGDRLLHLRGKHSRV